MLLLVSIPSNTRLFCKLTERLVQNFDPMEKKMIPIYLALILIVVFFIYEQTKSGADLIAEKIFYLLKEDFKDGKFRNGIRVDDIYLCYGVVIGGSRDFFYSKILPKMEKKVTLPGSRIEKTLNRAGILVWKLKE